MQNKTPIVVLTGLGIVAAAAVAGLTRDQWMGHKAEVVASATQPTPAEPAETPAEPAKTPAEPAKTPDQPAPAASGTASQTAPATPAAQTAADATAPASATAPATQTTAADATAPAQPAAEPPKADGSQQTAAAQPATQQPTTQQPTTPAAGNAETTPKVPAFDTVRVEKTGEAVIAGTARAGDDVVVKLDGKVIGETTANSSGAFVVVPDNPLPAGSGALTLEAKGKADAAPTASDQSVAVIVPAADQPQEALVAVVSPDQPTKVLQKPEAKPATTTAAPATPATTTAAEKPAKLVSIDAVDYDPTGNIVFSGQGNDGNTARVYIDNNFIGDAPVGADGHWSFSATAQVTPGVHTLRVDGLDSAGKVLNRVEVPFFREQQNKVVASATDTTKTPDATKAPDTAAAGQTSTSGQTAAATPATQDQTAPATGQNASAGQVAAPKEGRVIIQPGNNLWRISRVLYGNGAKFTTLYEANKDQIRNPNLIYPGQIFRTPDVASKAGTVDPNRRDPLKPEENAATGQ